MADQKPNFFDQFDDAERGPDDYLKRAGELTQGPRPTLIERFRENFQAGQRYNTLLGASADTLDPEGRRRFDAKYDALPQWDGLLEGAAALGGQLAGTALTPETLIPIGVGARVSAAAGLRASSLSARILAGAVDASIVNAVTDAGIQKIEIGAEFRETFDPMQWAMATGLGAAIGAGLPAAAAGARAAGAKVGEVLDARREAIREKQNAVMPERVEPTFDPVPDDRLPVVNEAAPNTPAKPDGSTPAETVAPDAVPDEGVTIVRDLPAADGEPMAVTVTPEPTIGEVMAAKVDAIIKTGEVPDLTPNPDFRAVGLDPLGLPMSQWPSAFRRLADEASPEDFAVVYSRATLLPMIERELENLIALKPDPAGRMGPDGTPLLDRTLDDGTFMGRPLEAVEADGAALGSEARLALTEGERAVAIEALRARQAALQKAIETREFPPEVLDQANAIRETQRTPTREAAVKPAPEAKAPEVKAPKADERIGGDTLARRQAMVSNAAGVSPRRAGAGTAAAAPSPQMTRLSDVSDALVEGLGVTVRDGRVKAGALGQYGVKTGVVRVRAVGDFETLTHELGHAIEYKMPDTVRPLMKRFEGELMPLAYDPNAPKKIRLQEGFAEYMRLFVTNPAHAAKQAPGFDAAFRAAMPADTVKLLDDTATAYADWLAQPSDMAVASTIKSNKRPGWISRTTDDLRRHGFADTIADRVGQVYQLLFDDLAPISRAVRALARIHVDKTGQVLDLKVGEDAYKLARMSRGAHTVGHMDIMHGVHGYYSALPETPSLRDALIEAAGAPNVLGRWDDATLTDFGAYLWSRRAMGEWDRFKAGDIPNPPDKLTEGDHAQAVADFEARYPTFKTAAPKVHLWARGLWKKKFDAGLITKETYDEGLKIKDYVPGLRYFDEDELAGAPDTAGGRDGRSRIVNRFKGSMRDVINPLESLMADAYETAMAIARNDAIKALANLSDRVGNDGGKIAERIPAHRLTAMTIDPLEALESAGKAAGLSAPERQLLGATAEAAIGDQKAMLFRPAAILPNGDPIVFFREGGETKALQLADGEFGRDMVAAFNMMTRDERMWWVTWLATPAAMLRAGITTFWNFILANVIRDQTMAYVFYGKPFTQIKGLGSGLTDELLGRQAAREYNAMGGIMGGENASAVRDLAYRRDIQAVGKAGFFWKSTTSLQGFLAMTELTETATRLQLYRRFVDEAQARGLTRPEAMLEGAWRARDHMDFDRRGSGMAALARVIPFLNATLQGFDKTSRVMIAPFVKKAFGQTLLADEARQLGESAKAWARLGLLVNVGMTQHILASRHDDYEEYDPQLRATHWVVPLKDGSDTALAIPKPFELAVVINAAEAVWDAWAKNDPTAAERYRQGLFDVIVPPNVIEDNPLIKYYWEVKTNRDTFRDRDLIPDHLLALEPFLQYTTRTSEIGKAVGKALDVSPILVDHLVTSFTGSWGRAFLSVSDQSSGEKPDYGWWDAIGTRRFIKDASRNATSHRVLWDLVGRTDGEFMRIAETYKAMAQNGDPDGAIAFLSRQDRSARAYTTVQMMEAKVKRMHPLNRARDAVSAISAVRKDLINRVARSADGPIEFTRADMTAADDILGDLAVAEARNALIAVGAPGFAKVRQPIPIDTYWRELETVAPSIAKALADAYATKKVYKAEIVHAAWPELERKLLKDGTDADIAIEVGDGAYGGFEFDGARIRPRERPGVAWPDD